MKREKKSNFAQTQSEQHENNTASDKKMPSGRNSIFILSAHISNRVCYNKTE